MPHGARAGWSSKRLAASSPTNSSFTGSKRSVRFSLNATAPMLTMVAERNPLRSFSAKGRRVRMLSRKLVTWGSGSG